MFTKVWVVLDVGANSAKLGRVGTTLGRVRPSVADCDRTWAQARQTWPTPHSMFPTLANIYQTSADVWPSAINIRSTLADVDQNCAVTGQIRTEFGRPELPQTRPRSGRCPPDLDYPRADRPRPEFGRCRPTWPRGGQLCAESAKFRSSSDEGGPMLFGVGLSGPGRGEVERRACLRAAACIVSQAAALCE